MLLISLLSLPFVIQIFADDQVAPTKLPKVPGCEVLNDPCTDGLSRCCDEFTFRNCVGDTVEQGDCRMFGFSKCVDGKGVDEDKAHCEQ